MPRIALVCCVALFACGCAAVEETGIRVHRGVKSEMLAVRQKLIDYTAPYEPPNTTPQSVPSSYCYKTQADVVCYRDPQPGAENRLIGYQEPPVEGDYQSPHGAAALRGVTITHDAAPTPVVSVSRPAFSDAPPAAGSGASPARPKLYDATSKTPVFVGAAPSVAGDGGKAAASAATAPRAKKAKKLPPPGSPPTELLPEKK